MSKLHPIQIVCTLAVSAVSIALRAAATTIAMGRTPAGDPLNYLHLAQNIVAGRGMVAGTGPLWEGLRAHYPPLYPFLLAIIGYAAPLGPPTYMFFNSLCDAAASLVLLLIARDLKLGVAGPLAAAIYFIWPTNILNAPVAQKESLAALLTLLTMLFMIRRRPIPLGIFAGLLTLTQPALMTLPIILGLMLRTNTVESLKLARIAVPIAALVMLPWWVRNYLIFNEFVPLTDTNGFALYIGNLPPGDGLGWFPLPDRLLALHNGPAISRAATAETLHWISAHPLQFVGKTFWKAFAMLQPDWWYAKPLAWMSPAPPAYFPFRAVPALAFLIALFGSLIGSALLGGTVLRKLFFACAIQLFVVQIWFQFPERHRYFLMPVFILIATEGFLRLRASLGARESARGHGEAAVAVVSGEPRGS